MHKKTRPCVETELLRGLTFALSGTLTQHRLTVRFLCFDQKISHGGQQAGSVVSLVVQQSKKTCTSGWLETLPLTPVQLGWAPATPRELCWEQAAVKSPNP